MRVDSLGFFQHRAFRLQANPAQPVHAGSGGACKGQMTEEWRDCRYAGSESARIHVGMAARIHMADEPRLRPGFQLCQHCSSSRRGHVIDNAAGHRGGSLP